MAAEFSIFETVIHTKQVTPEVTCISVFPVVTPLDHSAIGTVPRLPETVIQDGSSTARVDAGASIIVLPSEGGFRLATEDLTAYVANLLLTHEYKDVFNQKIDALWEKVGGIERGGEKEDLAESILEHVLQSDIRRTEILTSVDAAATALKQRASELTALVETETIQRTDALNAIAAERQTIAVLLNDTVAALEIEKQARIAGDSAEAVSREALTVLLEENTAAIINEAVARADAVSAETQARAIMLADIDNSYALLEQELIAQTGPDSTLASNIATLTTVLGGNTATIETVAQSKDGLMGQLTFKIDNNGFISGFGLASDTVNGTPFSEMISVADKHAWINPAASVLTVSNMYQSLGNARIETSTEHGVSVNDFVVVTGAAEAAYNGSHKVTIVTSPIEFGFSIDQATPSPATVQEGFPGLRVAKAVMPLTIENGQVVLTDALINRLTADKLVVPGTASIWDAIITQGKITNAFIDNIIQSSVYNPGTGFGWRLDKNGGLDISSLTIRQAGTGQVILSSGAGVDYGHVNNGPPANATPNNIFWQDTEPAGETGAFWIDSTGQVRLYNGSAWIEGKSGRDAVNVLMEVPEGYYFKNNAGAVKSVKASVYIGGVKQTDAAHDAYTYRWTDGGSIVYADTGGNYVQLTPSAGLYPADPNEVGGLNFRTLLVDASDVAFTAALNLSVEVGNIPD